MLTVLETDSESFTFHEVGNEKMDGTYLMIVTNLGKSQDIRALTREEYVALVESKLEEARYRLMRFPHDA